MKNKNKFVNNLFYFEKMLCQQKFREWDRDKMSHFAFAVDLCLAHNKLEQIESKCNSFHWILLSLIRSNQILFIYAFGTENSCDWHGFVQQKDIESNWSICGRVFQTFIHSFDYWRLHHETYSKPLDKQWYCHMIVFSLSFSLLWLIFILRCTRGMK